MFASVVFDFMGRMQVASSLGHSCKHKWSEAPPERWGTLALGCAQLLLPSPGRSW